MGTKHGWEIESLSKSALTTFEKCGMQYQFSYLQGAWLPGSFKMIIGLCLGFAAEVAMDYKADMHEKDGSWTDIPQTWLEAAFLAKWDDEVFKRTAGVKANEFDPDAESKNPMTKEVMTAEEYFEGAMNLLNILRTEVLWKFKPIATEVKFEIKPPGLNGKAVRGVIDLIHYAFTNWETGETNEEMAISDFKTKLNPAQYPEAGQAALAYDLKLYGAGFKLINGFYPSQMALVTIWYKDLVKGPKMGVLFDAYTPNDADVERVFYRIGQVFKAINAEAFPGASALLNEAMGCSERACGYFRRCPAHF